MKVKNRIFVIVVLLLLYSSIFWVAQNAGWNNYKHNMIDSLLFKPIHPYDAPLAIRAVQAELMRLGFYKGKVDGKAGVLTLSAEVEYLEAILDGKKFKNIYEQ
ncbi:hypothetical protein LCGC14_2220340 [marine sediment metagenome]|uniref:Peptidoglycan binding-like domain-containing protein n=1 Tax=marine sediment metagenome TaxID=412755 RepID=A0A0F9DBA7_9ZZZZ